MSGLAVGVLLWLIAGHIFYLARTPRKDWK